MATANCYEKDGTQAGTFDLPASLFEGEINEHMVHEAVVIYGANQRQGDASTKERSDVRGGGRKPWRQKGTGRARAGTIRSPIFRGGGIVFGPHPRDYSKKMTKKTKRIALLSALRSSASDGEILVVKELEFSVPKTKDLASVLKKMETLGTKTLVVIDKPDRNTVMSGRNIPRVRITLADSLSTYDVVWADKIIITGDAVKKMEEVFA